MRTILAVTIYLLFFINVCFAGKEVEISPVEVPVEHYATAMELLEGFEMERAQIETEEDGTEVYELIGYHDTVVTEIDMYMDGRIQEYEKNIPEKYVPFAVRKSIMEHYPGIKFQRFEASHNMHHKVIKYEIVGRYQGELIDLEVSPDGRKIVESDA